MIEIINLTKSYGGKHGRHYVFRDVNVTFPEGKSIGIVGRNGAGKTTLLRMLGGIDFPDSGEVRTNSTISWPVALRGGYHAQLTGRENATFVFRVFGLDESAIKERLDFVKDFSELGKYFEMPLQTYSSGMHSRLGFAMSMAFEFDYYLIDEITAVGDRFFKRKSQKALAEKRKNAAVIMVSHSLGSLADYCEMGLMIENQEVRLFDKIEDAISAYEKLEN